MFLDDLPEDFSHALLEYNTQVPADSVPSACLVEPSWSAFPFLVNLHILVSNTMLVGIACEFFQLPCIL